MKNLMWSVIFLLCVCIGQLSAVPHFEIKPSQGYENDIDIHLYDNGKHIGFASYTKMPFLPFYILHNGYVYPEHRKQGYGTRLLLYACKVIKKLGAKRAYIQPGPFEIVDGRTVRDKALYNQEMKRLVNGYKRFGFKPVFRATAMLAAVAYRIMGIDEDAQYLLVKEFN